MPSKDLSRWTQTADGSWTRAISDHAEQGIQATAGAVKAADEHGIDLATIQGTGKDGKITKADVENIITD